MGKDPAVRGLPKCLVYNWCVGVSVGERGKSEFGRIYDSRSWKKRATVIRRGRENNRKRSFRNKLLASL